MLFLEKSKSRQSAIRLAECLFERPNKSTQRETSSYITLPLYLAFALPFCDG